MRIAIIGTGRMGSVVRSVAQDGGWEVCAEFDSTRRFSDVHDLDQLHGARAIVDFSQADALDDHVRRCVDWRFPLVCGTTGVADRLDLIRSYVDSHGGSMLYSPNFSLGIAMLRRAVMLSLELASHMDSFDVAIQEVHHTGKKDRPSGTALQLADDVSKTLRRNRLATDNRQSVLADDWTPDVSSIRVGHVFGEHTVRIEGSDDRIVMQHAAYSRRGFARGALEAVGWLVGRTGFYTMDDMVDEWITHRNRSNTHAIET